MASDRAESRRRVRTITGWAAAGAAALTAGLAFGAARGSHAAQAPSGAPASAPASPQQTLPEAPQDNQGFTPPSASTGPPAGMSGGS